MEKEKTFEELARDVVRKQVNEEMLTGTDIETATKFGAARTVRGAATEEEKAEVRNMYRKGIGVCEIARRTGFAQSTISRWVGTWQIDPAKSVKAKGNKGAKTEPAPAGTETSPKAENTANKTQVNDTPISEICQAPEYESAQEYSNFMLGLVTNAFGKADVGTLIADKGYCSVDFKFNGRDCCLSFRMEPPNADQN